MILGIAYFLLACCLSLNVILRRRDPERTMAWILAFFLVPIFSACLYLFFGYQRYRRERRPLLIPSPRKRLAHPEPLPVPNDVQSEVRHVARLAVNVSGFPVLGGNKAALYLDSRQSHDALAEAIANAKEFVNIETYILSSDEVGRRFRELLIQAAQRGVACRLLIDAVGSLRLRTSFLEPLKAAGVEVMFFSPLRHFRRVWHMHLRNHRKIAVIDGRVAWIGSQNLVDNYLGRRGALLWNDAQMEIEGPLVANLESIFAEDWRYVAGKDLARHNSETPSKPLGSLVLQALPSGPDLESPALAYIFLSTLQI